MKKRYMRKPDFCLAAKVISTKDNQATLEDSTIITFDPRLHMILPKIGDYYIFEEDNNKVYGFPDKVGKFVQKYKFENEMIEAKGGSAC